jgi:hypothetical protein
MNITEAVDIMDSADGPPVPISAHDLAIQWNQRADPSEQWDTLEPYEQLAWAQARAIALDRSRRAPVQPAEGEVAEFTSKEVQRISDAHWDRDKCELDWVGFANEILTRWGSFARPVKHGEAAELAEWLLEDPWLIGYASSKARKKFVRVAAILQQLAPVQRVTDHWTPTPPMARMQPQTVTLADVEVAELVAALRDPYIAPLLRERTRAADLLQHHQPPQPVAVSERLPGAEDCDAGRCYWGRQVNSRRWSWTFSFDPQGDTHWLPASVQSLPAHALPTPTTPPEAP